MSSNAAHDNMTNSPQSLPSFAQAFSTPSLSRITSSNALPPIQHRASPLPHNPTARDSPRPPSADHQQRKLRKRLHEETLSSQDTVRDVDEDSDSEGRRSPRAVRIKQEAAHDVLPSSSATQALARSAQQRQDLQDASSIVGTSAPSPSSAHPSPLKKRRVTISGISHPINTDVRPPADPTNNNVSPVVMGYALPRNDPAALEQFRSMITVKEQQKALIEQRRGSAAGILSSLTSAAPTVNVVNATAVQNQSALADDRPLGTKVLRSSVRSPIQSPAMTAATASHRRSIATASPSHGAPPSPIPSAVAAPSGAPTSPHLHSRMQVPPSAHPPAQATPPNPSLSSLSHSHALPTPPISFAHRRASRARGKAAPADIVISPRDSSLDGSLQPVIQSAPPIPRGSGSASHSGRFVGAGAGIGGMTLPSIPSAMAHSTPRTAVSRVPPTPTRLGMPRTAGVPGGGRSPPGASVPIASTSARLPTTPAFAARAYGSASAYAHEKSAFLAPFETFFDALTDAAQLKAWLAEQLAKAQQLDNMVERAVERRVGGMREEIGVLRRRVEELEGALRARGAGPAHSQSLPHIHAHHHTHAHAPSHLGYQSHPSPGAKGKAKANGAPPPPPLISESYTFPPVGPPREGDAESRSFPGSPIPGRRLSVSAMRLETREAEEGPGLRGREGAGGRDAEGWWEREGYRQGAGARVARSPTSRSAGQLPAIGQERPASGVPSRGERQFREREAVESVGGDASRRGESPETMSVDRDEG